MILKEKERAALEDLQTQEKSCIEKYGRYAQQARDPELKNLFQTLLLRLNHIKIQVSEPLSMVIFRLE